MFFQIHLGINSNQEPQNTENKEFLRIPQGGTELAVSGVVRKGAPMNGD